MAGIRAQIIRPKPLNRAAMTKELEKAAKRAARDMAKDMTVITKGWSDGGLKFIGKVQSGRREKWLIEAVPEDPNSKRADIFMFLDEGTKGPYKIRPKKPGGVLRFTSGYKAGSKPNRVSTTASRRFGPTVYANEVTHPGIEARNWTKLRVKKLQKKLPEYLQEGMNAAVKASGHAYKGR